MPRRSFGAARGGRSSGAHQQHQSGSSSLMAVDKILSKDYRAGIAQNHTQCRVVAGHMAIGGEIEKAMLQAAGDDETQRAEIVRFLEEQRHRLKALSEKNVQAIRGVDIFVEALRDVRNEIVEKNTAAQQQQPDGEIKGENDGGPSDLPDYERIISEKMTQYTQNKENEQLNMEDEEFCREIKDRLGEKTASKKRKGNDDDDEIEMLPPTQGTMSSASLKCPITGMYYQDPVKSKTCGHTYSMAGLRQYMRNAQSCKCPVPGCSNMQVTMANVEKDLEMEILVKNQLRREEREQKQRQSQYADDEDDFEEAEAVL